MTSPGAPKPGRHRILLGGGLSLAFLAAAALATEGAGPGDPVSLRAPEKQVRSDSAPVSPPLSDQILFSRHWSGREALVAASPRSAGGRLWTLRLAGKGLASGLRLPPGARRLTPLGPRALLVETDRPGSLQHLPGVVGVEPFGADAIIDSRCGRTPALSASEAADPVLPLVALLLPGADAVRAADALHGLGARSIRMRRSATPVALIRFELHRDLLAEAALHVPGLLRIEPEPLYGGADEESASVMQRGTFRSGETPLWNVGIDGGGGGLVSPQIIAVLDTGLSYDALHMSDTVSDAGTPGPGHSKLESYTAVGGGDLLACDAPGSGGSTHGNVVAGIAAGNVSRFGIDLRNNPGWEAGVSDHPADGVARGARVVFQDAQSVGACSASFDSISPGDLFDRMTEAKALGAAIHNMSFSASSSQGQYTADSLAVDQFLRANREYLVVAAAGNEGSDFNADGNYEYGSITAPATAKNVLSVGASNSDNEPVNPFDPVEALAAGVPNDGLNLLSVFTEGSTGRGPATAPGRVKPDVMAPGQDTFPNLRIDGLAACRSSDDDNSSAAGGTECILDDNNDGTSFAAAAVSGAAALVRDYFAQGFADDGAAGGPQVGRALSGAAVKAILVASAEFMRVSPGFKFDPVQPTFDVPDLKGRFNFEQGYGRVNLNRILPLNTEAASPSGVMLEDQGITGGLLQGQSFSTTVTVLDPGQELRVALAWMDLPDLSGQGLLLNDLDLEVIDHGPDNMLGNGDDVLYRGNFFSEDQGSFDGTLIIFDPNNPILEGEDSDGDGLMDESAFSLPVFTTIRNYRDRENTSEAVMLSPDPDGDGDTGDTQLADGRQFTVRVDAESVSSPFETVISPGPNLTLDSSPGGDDFVSGETIVAGADGIADSTASGDDVQEMTPGQSLPQPFALVIGGGVVQTAAVSLNASRYLCNDLLSVKVLDDSGALTANDVSAAVQVQVLQGGVTVLDTEAALDFIQDGVGRFSSAAIPVIDGVAAIDDDTILSVADGAEVVATYLDADGPAVEFRAAVACKPNLGLAMVAAPGVNRNFGIRGGCDAPRRLDPRGVLAGVRPRPGGDIFLDAGERITYTVAVINREPDVDLIDAVATLRAVIPDGDDATDPERLNNPPADGGVKVTLLNSSQDIGLLPRGTLQSVNFEVEVEPGVAFPEQIEMVFGISARRNGLPVESVSVFLHTLNMDLETFAYSTDFPTGGSENRVYAGEFGDPATPALWTETFVFADATDTAFGGGNPQWAGGAPEPKAPWTFDLNDEGFTTSRRFDSNGGLNQELNLNLWHWAPTGECGFQSNDPGQTDPDFTVPGSVVRGQGGIWHTGTIGLDPPEAPRKFSNGRTGFDIGCEDYDVPVDPGTATNEKVLDVLSSPVFHRVHVNPDLNGFNYTLEFTRFAFNHQLDIGDANVIVGWELDPDVTTPDPVDPLDFGWLNAASSARGFLTGVSQIPYAVFNPNNPHEASTPTGFGPQGPGSPGSFFDANDPAKAPARSLGEVGGRGFGTLQLRGAGGLPLRNVEEILDGLYGADTTFEDLFGANENGRAVPPIRRDDFQVHFGMFVKENSEPAIPTVPTYGIGIDDVVVEWIESHPVADAAPCFSVDPMHPGALGGCARISWDRAVIYEPEDSAILTIVDPDAAFGPDGQAGTGDEQAVDTDGDGFLELEARVFSEVDLAGEIIRVEQVSLVSQVYQAVVQLSSTTGLNAANDNVIFMQQNGDGTDPVTITAQYNDLDDGTGMACVDNPLRAFMNTQFVGGNVLFVSATVTDLNGDLDDIADDGETVRLDVTLVSNMLDSAENPVLLEDARLFLSTTDSDVACITDNVADFGDLVPGQLVSNPPGDAFEFVVGNVNRSLVSQILRADFLLGITGTFVDISGRRRTVSSFATPQRFSLNLDLDVINAGMVGADLLENWDSVPQGGDGVNTFTMGPLFPMNDPVSADGSRCQYHDPDGPNPSGGGRDVSICRPWNGSDWHVMTPGNAPLPKAYSGDSALYMGTHEPGLDASFDSYTTAQISAATSPAFHLGMDGGATLSFRHIVSLADDRTFDVPSGEAADRAVVQAALVDPMTGQPISFWETLPAFQNNYANQGTTSFINCKFDPVDDLYETLSAIPSAKLSEPQNTDGVSTEDDYFDPNDPERSLGPSSTCSPQFVFATMGDWTSNDPANSGRAFVAGETGVVGSGIWVESKFNLDKFAGQSVRVRFVFTGIELGGPTGQRWAQFFGNQLGNATRGWLIDDFRVSGVVPSPVELAADISTPPASTCPVDPFPGTPANEAACDVATADGGPDQVSPAPGFLVTLDGGPSSLDRCVDGFIEYRWRFNGRIGQNWSNDAVFRDNPAFATAYSLDVRCSVDPECADTTRVVVSIGGNLREVSQGSGADPFLAVDRAQRIATGTDGLSDSVADPGTDDVQVTPVGLAGAVSVSAGPDGVLQTAVAGDDVAELFPVRLDWTTVGAGFAYDVQRLDLVGFDPTPLPQDPAAVPTGTLPPARLCRLASTGDGVVTFEEGIYDPAPGQLIAYMVNSRRIGDNVPSNLGAGLSPSGVRVARPAPSTTACP